MSNSFSQKITRFHGIKTPEEGFIVGYALLIDIIEKNKHIIVPLPNQLSLVTEKHQRYNTEQWQVFTIRHKPNDDIISHLIFALKYEGIDLYILNLMS